MSQRNLNPQQLQMFMATEDIIDNVHKGDSGIYGPRFTPRQQWENPDSSYRRDQPLRDEKLKGLEQTDPNSNGSYNRAAEFDKPYETMPPLEIWHGEDRGVDGMSISNGHHRLAWAEQRRVPYLAVTHHETRKARAERQAKGWA